LSANARRHPFISASSGLTAVLLSQSRRRQVEPREESLDLTMENVIKLGLTGRVTGASTGNV
jgi:hypothetical protein